LATVKAGGAGAGDPANVGGVGGIGGTVFAMFATKRFVSTGLTSKALQRLLPHHWLLLNSGTVLKLKLGREWRHELWYRGG